MAWDAQYYNFVPYITGTLNYGAVACVSAISNPISLARMVMEKSSHVMLVGEGANKFATEMGVPKISNSELITPAARILWENFEKYNKVVSDSFNLKSEDESIGHDTVGAVALDVSGNFAAATSTGGISLQKMGRVGDSPLIGSGACCDKNGGMSCTGHGESIAKVVLAHRALSKLSDKGGTDLEGVLKDSLGFMLDRVGGRGGMIGIGIGGVIAKYHTTPRMSWASVDGNGIRENGIQSS